MHNDAAKITGEKDFVLGLIRGMDMLSALYAGLKLDVFEMIESGCATPQQMHERKGYDIRALSALLDTLRALSFLETKGDEFTVSPFTRQLLKNKEALDNIKLARAYSNMFNYPARVRGSFYYRPSPEDWEDITDMGAASAGPLTGLLLELVPALQEQDILLVDVGCGQGFHLMELARANTAMRCIGIDDNGAVLDCAGKNLEKSGLTSRVKLQKGDMRSFDFGSGVDAITIFTALRGLSLEEVKAIATKAYHSLKPGGYLIIQDFFLEDDRKGPLENVIFDMRLALSSENGLLLKLSEFAALKDVGFDTYTRHIIAKNEIPVKDSAYHIYRK